MPNFSLEMRKKRRKTAIILWEKLLQGIHNDVVFAGDNFFFFEIPTTLQNILLVDSKPSLVAIFLQNYNSIHQQIVFFYLSAEQLRFAYPVANFPLFFVSLYAMNKNLLFFFLLL